MFGFKSSLPTPNGPFCVGYVDLMTPGTPDESIFMRIYYPSEKDGSVRNPPVWTFDGSKHLLLDFLKTMVWNWPSWVNSKEYRAIGFARKVSSPNFFYKFMFEGWSIFGRQLTIPINRSAKLASHSENGLPVVVFSHGMGCNRFTMSQVCYQLASQGVVVVAIEHREGSGFGSYYVKDGNSIDVPHYVVKPDKHEYEERNKQVNHRYGEIVRTLDILQLVNAGISVNNVCNDSTLMNLTLLKSSMDLNERLFLMGHSFGGASVLLASKDPRVKAILALDPWMFPLFKQEFSICKAAVILNTAMFRNAKNLRVIRGASKDMDLEFLVCKSGVHLGITDIPCVFKQEFIRKSIGLMDEVSTEDVVEKTNHFIWNWLKKLI